MKRTITTAALVLALLVPASAGAVGEREGYAVVQPGQKAGFFCAEPDNRGITITTARNLKQRLRLFHFQAFGGGSWYASWRLGRQWSADGTRYAPAGPFTTVRNTGSRSIVVWWNCPDSQ